MQLVNLFDNVNHKYLSVKPDLLHIHPDGFPLAFEAYDERAKGMSIRQLTLGEFKVICNKGFVVGARSSLRAPRGIYTGVPALQKALFDQFKDIIEYAPATPNPHPLIHVIPEGCPGAGFIVVSDTAKLRENEEAFPKSLTFVEKQAKERQSAKRALVRLGFKLRGE